MRDCDLYCQGFHFPVVDSLSTRVAGQTQPSLSYLSTAALACSLESCSALSHDTDSLLSNKLSMRSRLLVLLWMGRPRYNG